jgi:hypothetical protein
MRVFFKSEPLPEGAGRVYTVLIASRHNEDCLLPSGWEHRVVRSTETRMSACQRWDGLANDWVEVTEEADLGEALGWLIAQVTSNGE